VGVGVLTSGSWGRQSVAVDEVRHKARMARFLDALQCDRFSN
jgi:hypothetical protein